MLHAVAAGPADGRLVLLLHGFPEFWYGWRHQIAALAAAGLRVVAPDQRGYNLSDKPVGIAPYRLDTLADDMLAAAEALGHDRFAVVGHDWGGVVAWRLAERNPEQVNGAAILNAPHPATLRQFTARHPAQALKSWYVAWFQLPALPELSLRAADFAILRRVLRRTARPGTFDNNDFRRYSEAWSRPGALTAMLNWYRALPRRYAAGKPARIRIPVQIIWGDRDSFLDRRLADAGAALCDDAEIHHLQDATHWLQHEEWDTVNRLLIGFLA